MVMSCVAPGGVDLVFGQSFDDVCSGAVLVAVAKVVPESAAEPDETSVGGVFAFGNGLNADDFFNAAIRYPSAAVFVIDKFLVHRMVEVAFDEHLVANSKVVELGHDFL